MARYINEALVNARLKEICDNYAVSYGIRYGGIAEKFARLTENTLPADVVEACRCFECKYYEADIICEGVGYCNEHQKGMRAEDFCSYGDSV